MGLVFVALFTAWLCLAPQTEIYARNDVGKTEIRGRVTDEAGTPLVGVTIVERGTPNGTATHSDGRFSIRVTTGGILDFSYLGYAARSVEPGTRTELEVVLKEDVKAIAEVIVTALGLERNYADLTYAADKIKGTELSAVKSPNMILALAGKSAGVQVNASSSGAGASAKVSMCGIRSVASDN